MMEVLKSAASAKLRSLIKKKTKNIYSQAQIQFPL